MTSPTDKIPEDVKRAAALATQRWDLLGSYDELVEDVARAIMAERLAERERCAKIAEGTSADFDFAKALADCRDSEHGFHSGRLHAASAIRGGR